MPIKKLFGSETEVVKKLKISSETRRTQDPYNVMHKDIPRTFIIDNELYNSLSRAPREEIINSEYRQGNLDAGRVSNVLYTNYTLSFCDEEGMINLNEEDSPGLNNGNIRFAYYDQDGEPCGFSINYHKRHPDQWVISIVKNTLAPPEERMITIFEHGEIISDKEDSFEQIQESTLSQQLVSAINSQTIAKLLRGIVGKGAQVNDKISNEVNLCLDFKRSLVRLKQRNSYNERFIEALGKFDELVENIADTARKAEFHRATSGFLRDLCNKDIQDHNTMQDAGEKYLNEIESIEPYYKEIAISFLAAFILIGIPFLVKYTHQQIQISKAKASGISAHITFFNSVLPQPNNNSSPFRASNSDSLDTQPRSSFSSTS